MHMRMRAYEDLTKKLTNVFPIKTLKLFLFQTWAKSCQSSNPSGKKKNKGMTQQILKKEQRMRTLYYQYTQNYTH